MHIMTNRGRRGSLALGFIALLAALLLTFPTGAQETERFDEKVRDLFFAGFAGNEDALKRGMAITEETLAVDPDHPGALVWQASGWFYESSFAFAQDDRDAGMALYNKSIAQFDRAVALAPDSLETLIPRAAVYSLPLRTSRTRLRVTGSWRRWSATTRGSRTAGARIRVPLGAQPRRIAGRDGRSPVVVGETRRGAGLSEPHDRRAAGVAIRAHGAAPAR